MGVVGRFSLAAILGAAMIGPASASEVLVKLVGQAGPGGDPVFQISIDGTMIGTGSVAPPVGAPINELSDLGAVASIVRFPIPDGLLRPDSVVGITLTNDSYDQATGADTNLYVAGVSIDGVVADATAATIVKDDGEQMPLSYVSGGSLVLAWTATARFVPPEGGWEIEVAEASTDAEGPAIGVDVAAAKVAAASETPTANDGTELQAPACTTEATTAVTDFANGEMHVTPAAGAELDAFFKDMATAGCKLDVVGYASPGGGPEINVAVSEGRAKSVLNYISTKQMDFASKTSSGFGETAQFGAPGENRRVVVTVSP